MSKLICCDAPQKDHAVQIESWDNSSMANSTNFHKVERQRYSASSILRCEGASEWRLYHHISCIHYYVAIAVHGTCIITRVRRLPHKHTLTHTRSALGAESPRSSEYIWRLYIYNFIVWIISRLWTDVNIIARSAVFYLGVRETRAVTAPACRFRSICPKSTVYGLWSSAFAVVAAGYQFYELHEKNSWLAGSLCRQIRLQCESFWWCDSCVCMQQWKTHTRSSCAELIYTIYKSTSMKQTCIVQHRRYEWFHFSSRFHMAWVGAHTHQIHPFSPKLKPFFFYSPSRHRRRWHIVVDSFLGQ